MKVSADQQTRETFHLGESVESKDANRIVQQINQDKKFKATVENDTLVVKQFLRD
jgi:hypothetical protein